MVRTFNTTTTWILIVRACPIWRDPVTLGGGRTREKTVEEDPLGLKYPGVSIQLSQHTFRIPIIIPWGFCRQLILLRSSDIRHLLDHTIAQTLLIFSHVAHRHWTISSLELSYTSNCSSLVHLSLTLKACKWAQSIDHTTVLSGHDHNQTYNLMCALFFGFLLWSVGF